MSAQTTVPVDVQFARIVAAAPPLTHQQAAMITRVTRADKTTPTAPACPRKAA